MFFVISVISIDGYVLVYSVFLCRCDHVCCLVFLCGVSDGLTLFAVVRDSYGPLRNMTAYFLLYCLKYLLLFCCAA